MDQICEIEAMSFLAIRGSMTMTLALEIWDAAVPYAHPADYTTQATSSDTAQALHGRDDIEEDASVVVLEIG